MACFFQKAQPRPDCVLTKRDDLVGARLELLSKRCEGLFSV